MLFSDFAGRSSLPVSCPKPGKSLMSVRSEQHHVQIDEVKVFFFIQSFNDFVKMTITFGIRIGY